MCVDPCILLLGKVSLLMKVGLWFYDEALYVRSSIFRCKICGNQFLYISSLFSLLPITNTKEYMTNKGLLQASVKISQMYKVLKRYMRRHHNNMLPVER